LRESAAKAAPHDAHATITWKVSAASRSSRAVRACSSLPQERHGVVELRWGRSSSTKSAFGLITGRASGTAEARSSMGKRTLGSVTNRSACAALALLMFVLGALPAQAARPLLDSGKWDNYFALFARNDSVPWKPLTLRLDTYSGAAVDFAAYDVDPADVLVAGANARPRAIDTSHRTAVARWRFTPPPGLRFASNDVAVPLQNREGFFVIEARRGTAVQQVWLNLSRVGLITKESAGGSFVYAADLGTGRALSGMRVTYLVGRSFTYGLTDAHGVSRVPGRARFALAEWGKSRAFVSFLPQSPPPSSVVAVRVDRGAVRAGETVRVIGFVRKRSGDVYKPATGNAELRIVANGRELVKTTVELDGAGAFGTELAVPADAPAGDVVVLASAAGASGGATMHVDGVGDTALTVQAPCTTSCPSDQTIPLTVAARRLGLVAPNAAIRVRVIRTPHVLAPGQLANGPAWGTTPVVDATVTTDATGLAHVTIPAPSDGLASTYGVIASSGASTASTTLVAPNAKIALAVRPLSAAIDVSDAAAIDIDGFGALDGAPAAGLAVHVTIAHGPTAQQQDVTLDANGHARVTFSNVALGMNLVSATAAVDGRSALDVAAVTVAPQALGGAASSSAADVHVALDRARYHPGDRVGITATLPGASGDALVTMESQRGATSAVVSTRNGTAAAWLTLPETIGATSVGVAFVRDGAIVNASVPLTVDGPGHQRALTLALDRASYAPGSVATIAIADGGDTDAATLAVRVSDRRVGSGASFDDVPGVLAGNGTTTQNLASSDPPWHTWVAPANSTAGDIFGFDRPRELPAVDTPRSEVARVFSWAVDRSVHDSFDVVVPKDPGTYVLAVVKITDDGDVGSASIALTVQ